MDDARTLTQGRQGEAHQSAIALPDRKSLALYDDEPFDGLFSDYGLYDNSRQPQGTKLFQQRSTSSSNDYDAGNLEGQNTVDTGRSTFVGPSPPSVTEQSPLATEFD
ncbi:hypothetical protein MBLNU13_g10390t1 [Cladosporium sp. NU13]